MRGIIVVDSELLPAAVLKEGYGGYCGSNHPYEAEHKC